MSTITTNTQILIVFVCSFFFLILHHVFGWLNARHDETLLFGITSFVCWLVLASLWLIYAGVELFIVCWFFYGVGIIELVFTVGDYLNMVQVAAAVKEEEY